jgi:hypothetical protein
MTIRAVAKGIAIGKRNNHQTARLVTINRCRLKNVMNAIAVDLLE